MSRAARWIVASIGSVTIPLLELIWPDPTPGYTTDQFYADN